MAGKKMVYGKPSILLKNGKVKILCDGLENNYSLFKILKKSGMIGVFKMP